MTSNIFTRIGSCLAAAGLLAGIAFAGPAPAYADPTFAPAPPADSACDNGANGANVGNTLYVPGECVAMEPETDNGVPVQ